MCDAKCFFPQKDIFASFMSAFISDVNYIKEYLEHELSTIINVVKITLFNVATFGIGLQTHTVTTMRVKQNYLQYMAKYGVPEDGNWEPEKLREFD